MTVDSIHARCLQEQEGWCAVGWLQAASGVHNLRTWSSLYPLFMVVMAYSGNFIQQPILYDSTLQTVLIQKSNPFEVYIMSSYHSASDTKCTQILEKNNPTFASGSPKPNCLSKQIPHMHHRDFVPFYDMWRF